MNTQRITVSLPGYLYEDLLAQMPPGRVSRFVAQAVEKELTGLGTDPVEEFISLQKKLPKREKNEVLKAIKKGRL